MIAVVLTTLAAAVASLYITQPWDMYSTVLAAGGAATIQLSIAVRLHHRKSGEVSNG
jgi:hypothetical protein